MFSGRSAAFLGALGLLIGMVVLAVFAAPRVSSYGPTPDTAHVPASAPIRIEFDRPMDRTSVEARLSFAPVVPGVLEWEGDTLIYRPAEAWPTGEPIRVRLESGSRSNRFLPFLRTLQWTFEVGQPRLAYLWPPTGQADIYLYDLTSGETRQLTETDAGVFDYTVGPDGTSILYSAGSSDGATELRMLDLAFGSDSLLHRCSPEARCQTPTLAPGGELLAFEQFEWETTATGRKIPGERTVWLLPLTSGAEPVLAQPQGQSASTPVWSPGGTLSFYNESLKAVALLEPLGSMPLNFVPNGLGMLGSWSPTGDYLVLPEIVFPVEAEHDETHTHADFYSHILKVDAITLEVDDLSIGEVEDASPVYSPDGEWIAFGRKYLDERWTPGRQLWIMRPDGSQAHSITDEPDFSHTALAWNPESTLLSYMRMNQADPNQTPQIWVVDLEGNENRLAVEGGFLPQWIP